jgi:hypothetical protein
VHCCRARYRCHGGEVAVVSPSAGGKHHAQPSRECLVPGVWWCRSLIVWIRADLVGPKTNPNTAK